MIGLGLRYWPVFNFLSRSHCSPSQTNQRQDHQLRDGRHHFLYGFGLRLYSTQPSSYFQSASLERVEQQTGAEKSQSEHHFLPVTFHAVRFIARVSGITHHR